MNQLFSYLLQMVLVSGLLYGYYHFALRNQQFHVYNRYFLACAVLFSFTIPLLNIPVYFQSAPIIPDWELLLQSVAISISPDPAQHPVPGQTAIPASMILLYAVYAFFALLFLVRLLISLGHIRKLISHYGFQKIGQIRFVNTREPGTPFSFFQWMFWDQRVDPLSDQGKQVFRHELYHITQRHSLDILFMELVTLLAWFNPFFHLYKKEMKAIHEFLADEYAMKEAGSASYAELLLVRAFRSYNPIVNPFFHNQIKRRLHMILKDKNPGRTYFRKIMVLPLIAVSLILFAFSYKTTTVTAKDAGKKNPIQAGIVIADTSKPTAIKLPDSLLVVIDGTQKHIISGNKRNSIDNLITADQIASMNIIKGEAAVKKYGKEWENGVIEITSKSKTSLNPTNDLAPLTVTGHPISPIPDSPKTDPYQTISDSVRVVKGFKMEEEENRIFQKVEIEPGFPGGNEAFKEFLEKNLNRNIGKNNGAPEGNYSVVLQFVVGLDGSLSDIKALTNFGYGMEAEAIRVMKLSPKWITAIQNGRKVVAYRKQVLNFYLAIKTEVRH